VDLAQEGAQEGSGPLRRLEWRRAGPWFLVNLAAERERWPLWLPVLMGAGIGLYFSLKSEPPVWIGPVALLFTALAAGLSWRSDRGRFPAAGCLAFALGFASAQFQAHHVAAPVLERRVFANLEGRVSSVDPLPEGSRLVIAPGSIGDNDPAKLPARVRVRLRHGDGGVAPGDWVRLRVSLEPPPAPAMPGAYDFERAAWFERLGGVGYALSAPEQAVPPEGAAPGEFGQALNALRQGVTSRIRATLPNPEGATASALITGETHAIPPEDAGAFRDAGLAHILVIAGLHMGMVAGICFFALRAIFALIPAIALNYPTKKFAACLALAMTFGYMLLSGATVSSRRAFAMIALALLAVLVDRFSLSARCLALAAVAIMLMTPSSAMGPSFQMSFAAVAALVAFYESYRVQLSEWHCDSGGMRRFGLYLLGISFTTIVTTVATAPFTVYHFNRFPLYSVAANVAAVPITGFWVMPWAIVSVLLMPVHLEFLALHPMAWGIDAIWAIAKGVTSWPGAVMNLPSMPAWGLGVLGLGGLWLCIWRRRWRYLGFLPVALGLASIWLSRPPDILFAGDGKLMAVRDADGNYLPSLAHGDRSAEETWSKRAASHLGPVWPDSGASADGSLSCDTGACVYRARGTVVTLIRDADHFDRAQCSADLVLATMAAWKICPGARIIDRIDTYRNGGYAVWLDPGAIRVDSVRHDQGARLWSPKRGRDAPDQ
jgi:competence protein ComEC